jgi:enoyl-CoA hydratase
MPSLYDSYSVLKFDRRGAILTITLDNGPMNTMTRQMHFELSRVFQDINRDEATSIVVLTGAGDRAFSAGGDASRMKERLENPDHQDWNLAADQVRQVIYGLLGLEKPLITRINGHAMGFGATLAVFGDFSFMIDSAKIADTHVKVGLCAGDGGALMWPLLMGFAKARRYLLTGDVLTGRQAADLGLISEAVATPEQLDEAVYSLAERLERGAPLAIRATKMAINMGLRRMIEGLPEAHFGLETQTYLSQDHQEAVRAILEKRPPVFTGK